MGINESDFSANVTGQWQARVLKHETASVGEASVSTYRKRVS